MKKLIAILLSLSLLFSCSSLLISCSDEEATPDTEGDAQDGANSNGGGTGSQNAEIAKPPFKDYGRGTVDFSKLVYSTPSVSSLVEAYDETCEIITKNELSFEAQIEKIDALEQQFSTFTSMYALARINLQKNPSDSYWSGEFEKLSKNLAILTQKNEELFVAAASSPHKTDFESEYFHASLDSYVDGGRYTDEIVKLLSREAELEAEYASLSEATVEITFNDETATAKELLEKYASEDFGAETFITTLYEEEVKSQSLNLYIELLKVRRQIADALGYESYVEFAYETSGHDYSPEQMTDFLYSLSEDVAPVYYKLYNYVFGSYLSSNLADEQDYVKTVNTLYNVLSYTDEELTDVYAYMLQHGLYSIEPKASERYSGSFTTYIDSNESPFLFATVGNKITDYFTVAHEFGHFADLYVNYGEQASVDLAEVFSLGMEYLILTKLDTKMNEDSYKYMEYYAMYQAMNMILQQGYVAAFEHLAYSLEYHEITEQNLSEAANEALRSVFGNIVDTNTTADVRTLMIPHIIEQPCYVQSYCTSAVVALNIFFAENEEEGAGFKLYEKLLDRTDGAMSFEEELADANISSPFEENALKHLSNDIHRYFLGTDYFTFSSDDALDAA